MFSQKVKQEIAERVHAILRRTNDPELPTGPIKFILHVDGANAHSWANIRNFSDKDMPVNPILKQNLTV